MNNNILQIQDILHQIKLNQRHWEQTILKFGKPSLWRWLKAMLLSYWFWIKHMTNEFMFVLTWEEVDWVLNVNDLSCLQVKCCEELLVFIGNKNMKET